MRTAEPSLSLLRFSSVAWGLLRSASRLTRPLLVVCLGCALCCVATTRVRADAAEPARYVGLLSVGVPLRLTRQEDLGQDRSAPAFADALFGYLLSSSSRYHHGFALGVSTNLGGDGHYVQPLYAGEQLVLMPAYLGGFDLSPDLPLLGHAGLPILLGEGRSFGLELGATLGFRLLAGVSLFAEVDIATYVGTRSTLNALTSLELGVLIDSEVLP